MKSILRKKSLAATILIYSCIIFIIPTVTIFTKLYFSDIKKLKESIDNKNIKEVQYLSSIIEKKIEALDMIAIRISQEKKTSKFYMASGLTEEIDGISEIAKYKEISGFVDDILVYFKNDDYIYSTEGRSSFDTMFNLIYQYPASVRYEIINNLKNLNDPMLEKNRKF